MRQRIRETIETLVEAELEEASGAASPRQFHRFSAWETPTNFPHQPRRDHDLEAARSDPG